MKKGMIFVGLMMIFTISAISVSAGKYTYLKAYYDSLDDSCTVDSDCVIKNVENCCGYYPMCLNKANLLVPLEVQDICLNDKNPDCGAKYNVAYCRCQKLSGKTTRKCVGNTGRPVFNCGDGNCFEDEANVSSPNYCKKDCVEGASNDVNTEADYQACEKDSDCLSVKGGCCSCDHAGNATAINRQYLNTWNTNIAEQCKDTLCADMISQDSSCSKKARCQDNRCTLNDKECPMIKMAGCPDNTEIEFTNDSDGCRTGRKCFFKTNNGRNSEVKIMPEQASEKAIEKLGELGFNVTIKDSGTKDDKPVYEVSAEKEGKFLGIFKVKAKVVAEIDADTGAVIKVKKPWWGFLAGI